MSDYQGKRFSASRIPDPAKSGAARAPQQGRTSSPQQPRAPRPVTPSGYTCCISRFVIQYSQEVTPLFGAYRAIELYRAAAQKAPLRHSHSAHHHRHWPDRCCGRHLYQRADWL